MVTRQCWAIRYIKQFPDVVTRSDIVNGKPSQYSDNGPFAEGVHTSEPAIGGPAVREVSSQASDGEAT